MENEIICMISRQAERNNIQNKSLIFFPLFVVVVIKVLYRSRAYARACTFAIDVNRRVTVLMVVFNEMKWTTSNQVSTKSIKSVSSECNAHEHKCRIHRHISYLQYNILATISIHRHTQTHTHTFGVYPSHWTMHWRFHSVKWPPNDTTNNKQQQQNQQRRA